MEAIVLVGGQGTRLKGHIPAGLPKPLAPVGKKTFLDYLLTFLKLNGVEHVILATGFGGEVVQEKYGEQFSGVRLSYSHETTPLGTGGAIRQALEHVQGDETFILNGDCFFLINYGAFLKRFRAQSAPMSLAVKPLKNPTRYGTIQIDGQERILSFREKNTQIVEGLISGGVYLARKDWLAESLRSLPNTFSIETDFFEKVVRQFPVSAYLCDAYFIDIGVPEDYRRFCADIAEARVFQGWTLFLDRDGVINKNVPGEYVLQWSDFEFIPGALEALARLSRVFTRTILITNQRAVGRGLMSETQLIGIHEQMKRCFVEAGAKVDAIFVCPHDIEAQCGCRKPADGLFHMARDKFPDIQFQKSFFVGDSPSDWEVAAKIGSIGVAMASEKQVSLSTYASLQNFAEEFA